MEVPTGGADLQRTSSQASTTSTKSKHSDKLRSKPRKYSRNNTTTSTTSVRTPSDKSLTSFPSLSPINSPVEHHHSLHPRTPSPTSRNPAKSSASVEALTATTPSMRLRNALFDDTPSASPSVPGSLHHASDEHVERLIARHGAVVLVRQMAEDVAQRDAQITALRRRFEDRERVLRKMLSDCEVSNLDVEAKLRRVDEGQPIAQRKTSLRMGRGNRKASLSMDKSSESRIDQMMNEAMNDDMAGRASTNGLGIAKLADTGTDESLEDGATQKGKGTTKGWKDYIWSGSRKTSGASSIISDTYDGTDTAIKSRSTSVVAPKRKGLQDDLFHPPPRDPDTESHKSATSITSWALKLVAGTSQGGRESDGSDRAPSRKLSLPTGRVRGGSLNTTARQPSAAKAALTKVASQADLRHPRKKRVSGAVGPNGTIKAGHPDSRLAKLSQGERPQSPASTNEASELGPVEMDTIFSEDSRPPSLSSGRRRYQPTGVLTDRFGFIYDQSRRQRKRETSKKGATKMEMLRNGMDGRHYAGDGFDGEDDSEPRPKTPDSQKDDDEDTKKAKKWQDYLKTATFPTELLSHTPSAGTLPTITTLAAAMSRRDSQAMTSESLSMPPTSLVPKDTVSPVTSETSTGTSTPRDQIEPVKLLLDQLTDLHDNIQQEKTIKWNEFLRKVRAERRRDDTGHPSTTSLDPHSMPETALTDGEMIGVAGLGNKGKVGRAKWAEFHSLVLSGIPVSYRAKIWAECSGATALRVPGYYAELVAAATTAASSDPTSPASSSSSADPSVPAQIAMDIHRTLTDNVFFRHGPGVARLNDVLLAYARRNPAVGYCQGMNLIAASLLLALPSAEDAFWILCAVVETLLPPRYYDASLLASRADQLVLRRYVRELLPALDKHLDGLGVALEALTFQWFLSLFTDCLSAEALYRVWDVLLCEPAGSPGSFLFHVALALLKLNERQLLGCDTPAKAYGYINHEITNHAISIDGLVQASEALKKVVKKADVEERRREAVEAEGEAGKERERRVEDRGGDGLSVREPVPMEDS
ncbi:MAG: hypothetical protein M1814_006662 [Vezdaea aestivalis]|nr:MAG: hypothetical protein M1814_006662 [Vezdaea aestivalis]